MTRIVGILLVLLLLVVYAGAIRTIVSAPFRALGILVAGMSIHNFMLMVLLRLETPPVIVRIAQAWKEGILLLLLLLGLRTGYARWREGGLPRIRVIDWMVIAFTAVALIYFLIPSSLLHGQANLSQRLLGLRVLLLLPLLYLSGRVFAPRQRADLWWTFSLVGGSAALVAIFGTVELWLVPTQRWLDWGVNLLSAWLGFTYHGPAGLPENFFQTTAEGYLLRRMVSTYVSPLAIAYTGLLIVPLLAIVVARRRAVPWLPGWVPPLVIALVALSVLLSVTRLALAVLVAEFVALYLLLRRRWLIPATLVVAGAAVFMITVYPRFGPLLTTRLAPVSQPRGSLHIASQSDPSAREHLTVLLQDLQFVRQHPLGGGLGSSIHRFGINQGTGESAVFDVFGDIGAIGGLLYVAIYALGLFYAVIAFWRARGDPLSAGLALAAAVGGLALIPISLTSDIWSDFSVTFLFWWAVGYAVTLAPRRPATTRLSRGDPPGLARPGLSEPDAFTV